jgi:tetratricopeptide (TPR) repeat protein
MGETANLDQQCEQAMGLKNQGRYDEAMAQFKAVLAAKPDHAPAHLGLGLVYCFVGMFDESLEELKLAVQFEPQWVDAHLNLAKTFAMLGMYEEARVEFSQVLALHPGHPEAKKQLSYFDQ